MATATCQRNQEQTSTNSWSSIFPTEQVTAQQSALFVKKLLAVAVSNISYLRAIFPEHAFGDRCLEDLNLKILRDDSTCPGACQVIKWVKGCFDAMDKQYLRMLTIGIFVDPDDPDTVIESYTFKFSYAKEGGIDIYRNDKKIAGAHSMAETRKATIRLLRTIVVLTQTLQSLPDDVMMTMKLLYYDDVTPSDYEPPGFKAAKSDSFRFEEEPMNIKVGDVSTAFHTIKMRIKTDSKQFEVIEDPSPENGNPEDMKDKSKTTEEKNPTSDVEMEEQGQTDANVYDFNDEPASEKVSLQGNGKHNSGPIDASVPTETPATPGSDDTAAEKTEQQKSQGSVHEDLGVRCPCGCNEDDGLMILCAICKYWQHGICFLIQSEDEAPSHHVCDVCAVQDDPDKQPTDHYLTHLSSVGVQATCLWRRTLMATLEMKRLLGPNLSHRLGVEMTVAQGLLNRLEKEGFIKNPGKGKRLGKLVVKEKIINEGIPKYFQKSSTDRTDNIGVKEHNIDVADSLQVTERSLDEKIGKLAEMTEEISLAKPGKKKRKKSTDNQRQSPRLAQKDEGTESKDKRRKGRKRAVSRVDGAEEFEVCDSQDVHESEHNRKRKKSSIVSRAIMV